jgi:hypothetical protein
MSYVCESIFVEIFFLTNEFIVDCDGQNQSPPLMVVIFPLIVITGPVINYTANRSTQREVI